LRERRVPIAAGKKRKSITLAEALIRRVRQFRFQRQFEQESDAYAALLEKGLEAVEREDRDTETGRQP
jgi:hypothetical protein